MADARQQVLDDFSGVVERSGSGVVVTDPELLSTPAMDRLVWRAVFGADAERSAARWLIWELAQAVGTRPASIHDLYIARGKGECGGFTVPAINVRMLAYDTARAIFRAARTARAGALILEIARSEISYTVQRPDEYVAVVLAAALREGYDLPVFIQGDHCQVNAKKYSTDSRAELGEVTKLIEEEVAAGFYNIDVDTSTLVDLAQPSLSEQQRLNFESAAQLTAFIRGIEPMGVTVSVGAEIGEVGMKNSTVEELHAFMEGYQQALRARGDHTGISKISVQTGTSHGGVVLPDGSIAEVKLDLEALAALSEAARSYGMAGAVQHGASTLPADAFGHFARLETAEIHLATNFQNIVFDHPQLPADLKAKVREWVLANAQSDRKEGDTEEQFLYRARKRAIGPFKEEFWRLPQDVRDAIAADLEATFSFLFGQLRIGGTAELVRRTTTAPELAYHTLRKVVAVAVDDPDAGE